MPLDPCPACEALLFSGLSTVHAREAHRVMRNIARITDVPTSHTVCACCEAGTFDPVDDNMGAECATCGDLAGAHDDCPEPRTLGSNVKLIDIALDPAYTPPWPGAGIISVSERKENT